MVSTWWLVLTFVAGGYAGFLLCAMLTVSRGTRNDAYPVIPRRRRGSPRGVPLEATR